MSERAATGSKGTALVTGASAGLGKELASLFARDGIDVVLVARSKDKLDAIAAELRESHQVRAEVIAADLGDPASPASIFKETRARGIDVDFLANNAGFGSSGPFLEQNLVREVEMVQVNVSALMELTHRYATPMRERGRGRILNIASTAGFQSGPFMATYYATKAFVVSFSEALAFELDGTGVTVTCHCPGATATEFAAAAGNDKSRLFKRGSVASAPEVAAHAYQAMMKGKILAVHGALNKVGVAGVRLAPRGLLRKVVAGLNRPEDG